MRRLKQLSIIAAALALAGFGAPVLAAMNTYTMTSGSNCSPGGAGCDYGNTRTFSAAENPASTVAASAWSNTSGTANVNIENAYLAVYSGGLGVKNRDGGNGTDAGEFNPPEHAVDNQGRFDSVLFSFSDAVRLSSVKLGYISTDSDISVLAYSGAGAPTLAGKSYSGLLGAGWTVVNNVSNVPLNTPTSVGAPASMFSSYWLISAYNSVFGNTWTMGNDFFKIAALTAERAPTGGGGAVPEPGSLALAGVAALALVATRRRKIARAA